MRIVAGVAALVITAQAGIPATAAAGENLVTFSEHVAPIFYENCTTCHRPGQVAPMSLLTYEDARPWARSIRQRVENREMPPWDADPNVGVWANDRSLSEEDIATIVAWADAGAPRGNPALQPVLPTYVDSAWSIGKPDAVFSIPPFSVPAEGVLDYHYFEVPTNIAEDKWVTAVEVRPDEPSVVHHVIVTARAERFPGAEREGSRRHRETAYRADGALQPSRGWNPGIAQLEGRSRGDLLIGGSSLAYPPGTAWLLAANSTLVFEMHYTPSGEPLIDETQIGLIFTDTPPERQVQDGGISHAQFVIPPGAADYLVKADVTFTKDVRLLNLFPHAHLRGARWEYEAVYPDGRRKRLLSVPEFDFNWQTSYVFEKPLALPAGSSVHAYAWYDNSAGNRLNPDPTAEVRWGDQNDEEMMFTAFSYLIDADAPETQ